MEKNWIVKPFPPREKIETLSKAINASFIISTLLLQRGKETHDDAKFFFRPSLEDLHDPFLMKNMDKAVERLTSAIQNNEKIIIYGDYDVDGTTSVALVYSFLKKIYHNVFFYIPDRHTEGYGVSEQGIDWASKEGATLIISLDCGIKSTTHVEKAKSFGIDFIICDHHLPGEEIPKAYAVLDAKQSDCNYPFKELSGCGVGYKLLQGFCIKNNIDTEILNNYLDLVAVSIAADMVPIIGENRILTFHGLKKLNSNPSPGFKALKIIAGLDNEMNIGKIVFGIAPRINAAGRVEHAHDAVNLLISENETEAGSFADIVNQRNKKRQEFDKSITREALAMIEESEKLKSAKTTVLYNENWHKGVIGIVASRMIEKYHRPTVILTQSNNKATGSARSIPGFDLYNAISSCSEFLDQFGGHTFAAGLTMPIENINAFSEKFEKVVSAELTEEMLMPRIEIDSHIHFNQINAKMFNVIKQMSPFGPLNMDPVFITEEVYLAAPARILKGSHLKISVHQRGKEVFDAIGFGMAHFFHVININKPFKLCYQIDENNYNGKISLQLVIKDIKI